MGYDHNDSVQITKPKHRIIADAYAKRMDEIISVSIDNTHADPAGLNFDMNHLDAHGSEAMDTTLTNYLSNIIHRRNAMTTHTRINFNDSNCLTSTAATADTSHRHSSVGVDINNSWEIDAPGRHSIDSQASVKMSKIKARLDRRRMQKCNKNSIGSKAKRRARKLNAHLRRRTNRSNLAQNGQPRTCAPFGINGVVEPLHPNPALVSDSLTSNDGHAMNDKFTSVDQMIRTFLKPNSGNHVGLFHPSMSGLNGNKCQKYIPLTNGNELMPSLEPSGPPKMHEMGDAMPNPITNRSADRSKKFSPNSNCKIDSRIETNDYRTGRYHAGENSTFKTDGSQSKVDKQNTETHHLLANRRREPPMVVVRKENLSEKPLSEPEKMEQLNRLLLPSK